MSGCKPVSVRHDGRRRQLLEIHPNPTDIVSKPVGHFCDVAPAKLNKKTTTECSWWDSGTGYSTGKFVAMLGKDDSGQDL